VKIDNNIAVVCPTYNSAEYIRETIRSLIEQTVSAEELIFSDDGSTDDTVEILEENMDDLIEKGYAVTILKNSHQGPGATRNEGIIHSKSDWISFLDADDLWRPKKIEKVQSEIESNPEYNVFLHAEEYIRLDGKKSIMMHGENYQKDNSLSKQLYRGCFFSTSAVTLHKSVLKEGLFDPTLPNGQDYELWLRSSPYMELYVLPEILGAYVEQPGSITAKPYYKRYLSQMRILSQHYKKGGLLLALYMLTRTTISRQWLFSMRNILIGKNKHAW